MTTRWRSVRARYRATYLPVPIDGMRPLDGAGELAFPRIKIGSYWTRLSINEWSETGRGRFAFLSFDESENDHESQGDSRAFPAAGRDGNGRRRRRREWADHPGR